MKLRLWSNIYHKYPTWQNAFQQIQARFWSTTSTTVHILPKGWPGLSLGYRPELDTKLQHSKQIRLNMTKACGRVHHAKKNTQEQHRAASVHDRPSRPHHGTTKHNATLSHWNRNLFLVKGNTLSSLFICGLDTRWSHPKGFG